jgi:Transposase DDE domain group 1
MRRRLRGDLAASAADDHGQQKLSFVEIGTDADVYGVLVTSLEEDLSVFGQVYRDRGDAENIFDELKNQWGWGGFTTHDLARCHLAARLVALFYNWWNIFARLAEPDRHMEAITSRPLLLHAIATRVRHARQTTITIASSHAKSIDLTKNAEQLTSLQRWRAILSKAFEVFLNGRQLRLPPRLAPS